MAEVEVYGVLGATTNNFTIQESESGYCSVDGTIDSNNAGYTGSGFVNTTNALGNGVNWQITGSAGAYTFTWRYASTSNRPGNLIVNGSTVDNVSFNSTGAWTTWVTESSTVTLGSGLKDIRLESTTGSGLGNIDYMEVTGPDAATSACCSGARFTQESSKELLAEVSLYPNPVTDQLSIFNSKDSNVEVYNTIGRLVNRGYIS